MGAQRDVIFPKSFESEQGLGKTLKVDEVMKNEIITVGSTDDLAKACQLLLDNKINGVGVLSNKGNLINPERDQSNSLALILSIQPMPWIP